MQVRLKQGARVKTDAATIYEEINACKKGTDFDLKTIVDRARPKNAPLHAEFTWDNKAAADKWRLEEARYLTRAIEVIHPVTKQTTRAWEAITVQEVAENSEPTTKRVFRSIEDVMADPEARNELLIRAIREATSWRRKYAHLSELAKIHAAVDETILQSKAA